MGIVHAPPLVVWLIGVLFGVIAQTVASRIRYNGEWDDLDLGMKIAMSLTGGVAAAVTGLHLLNNPDPDSTVPFLYEMWMWQIVAGWGGGLILDAAVRVLQRVLGNGRR